MAEVNRVVEYDDGVTLSYTDGTTYPIHDDYARGPHHEVEMDIVDQARMGDLPDCIYEYRGSEREYLRNGTWVPNTYEGDHGMPQDEVELSLGGYENPNAVEEQF